VTAPEFSRPVRIDTLGAEPRRLTIEADKGERTALARRFGLMSIASLRANATLTRRESLIIAEGRLDASVIQSCVATGVPLDAEVCEAFTLAFRPMPEDARPDEEIELSEAEMDVVFYQGASVDVGEAVAETLALSLDPYPRAPDADAALQAAGVKSEEEAGPFGALAALKDKTSKK
jgi:uncharacterized metal-binding protein YceD (DUF177 family)